MVLLTYESGRCPAVIGFYIYKQVRNRTNSTTIWRRPMHTDEERRRKYRLTGPYFNISGTLKYALESCFTFPCLYSYDTTETFTKKYILMLLVLERTCIIIIIVIQFLTTIGWFPSWWTGYWEIEFIKSSSLNILWTI